MVGDLEIRLARSADLPRLLSLYESLQVGPEQAVSLGDAQSRLFQLQSNPAYRLYVAELDRRIVGTFSMTFVPGLPHGARDSCVVEDVVVDEALQRSGIGRRMMRFAMQVCAERGCYKLSLSSHVRREAAHRFYEGLGFKRHGYSFLIDGLNVGAATS